MTRLVVMQELSDIADHDEPLLSGSGWVSKEVTDDNLLESWHEALTKWHQNLKLRPKQVCRHCHFCGESSVLQLTC